MFPSLIDWSKVESAMESACVPVGQSHISDSLFAKQKPAFPGAVLLVGLDGEVLYQKAFGSRSLLPNVSPMKEQMVFDIGSLTRGIVTTTLAMMLVQEGQLDLDWKISRIFQTFAIHGKEQMTVRHLLAHLSGYPPTAPFYKMIAKADHGSRSGVMTSRGAVEIIHNEIFRAKLDNLPGRVTKPSDIGFILLGHALEHLSGSTIEKLANRVIFAPLKMNCSGYIDLTTVKRKGMEPNLEMIVPTGRCPWRNRIICGEVHDDNAWAMGGVAPHAGVFSSALDIHRFATEMLHSYRGQPELCTGLVEPEVVREFWSPAGLDPQSSWGLGWDTATRPNSLKPVRGGDARGVEACGGGKYLSASSVGLQSSTGCSLWIDPERGIDIVLLSNRNHPNPDNVTLKEFRPLIHNLIFEALGIHERGDDLPDPLQTLTSVTAPAGGLPPQ